MALKAEGRPTIRNARDFHAGLLFVLLGLVAVGVARTYAMGTAARMGPRYFPTILGGLLVVLGVVVAARALRLRGEAIGRWRLRPLALVLGAVLAFAALVQPLGLVLATLAVVVVGRLAGPRPRPLEVGLLSLALTALAVGLFVWGLRLPFKVWPP